LLPRPELTQEVGKKQHDFIRTHFHRTTQCEFCGKKVMLQIASLQLILLSKITLGGCETWSLTLREEHRLRVFENRVLRRICGPKKDEVMGEWRKLHNEELRDMYSSPSIIRIIKSRRMRWVGHVARMGRRGTHIGYWWESQRERDH
jgi:hypothetical protein